MNIEIGKAAIEDKTRIQEILSIYNMGHFGHSEREAMPKIENFFVAKDQGRIIGCAAFLLNDESELTRHDKQAEIGSLAVLPEYRRQCIGRQLVVTRLLRMAKMGIEIVFMETDAPENID